MNTIDTDSYAGWVLRCLGVWNDGDYLDKMESDFCVELHPTDEETIDDIRIELETNSSRIRLGDRFAMHIFDAVIEKAINELEANDCDFEYRAKGFYDTELKCKGKVVKTWLDIVNIYSENIKKKINNHDNHN